MKWLGIQQYKFHFLVSGSFIWSYNFMRLQVFFLNISVFDQGWTEEQSESTTDGWPNGRTDRRIFDLTLMAKM